MQAWTVEVDVRLFVGLCSEGGWRAWGNPGNPVVEGRAVLVAALDKSRLGGVQWDLETSKAKSWFVVNRRIELSLDPVLRLPDSYWTKRKCQI